jgi:hypothetical protein
MRFQIHAICDYHDRWSIGGRAISTYLKILSIRWNNVTAHFRYRYPFRSLSSTVGRFRSAALDSQKSLPTFVSPLSETRHGQSFIGGSLKQTTHP